MNIGVDMDEVIADMVIQLLPWHNQTYETNFRKEQIREYDLSKLWGGTRDEMLIKFYEFYSSERFLQIEPVTGSIEGIKELSCNNTLTIITSRSKQVKNETYDWIDRYFPNKFNDIIITGTWAQDGFNIEEKDFGNKSEVCQRLGIDIMIEDCYQYAENCLPFVKRAILFNQPWNESFNPTKQGIDRVYTWPAIVKKVRDYQSLLTK